MTYTFGTVFILILLGMLFGYIVRYSQDLKKREEYEKRRKRKKV